MTAGTFRLGSLRVVEGERFSVPVSLFKGFGKKIFFRLSGEISKSDVRGARLSGAEEVGKDLKATISIDFIDDGRKEGSERFKVEISTDKSFEDPSKQVIPRSNSVSAEVLDAPSKKVDLITGIQDPSGNLGPKASNFTLGLISKTSSSKFGIYFAEFKPDLTKVDLFADSNGNGIFDGKDTFLDALKINSFANLGEFKEGVSRTFEYRQDTGDFSLKHGGRTYLEASGDGGLF
jgi:hypothetical protein